MTIDDDNVASSDEDEEEEVEEGEVEDEEECEEDEESDEEHNEELEGDENVNDQIRAGDQSQNDAETTHKEKNEEMDEGLTEATKAVLAAKRRQEEEKRQDYEDRRKAERERVETELRSLREKQERRRREREQEEKELAEKLQLDEERRRHEEEESRARIELQKQKRDEERRKKQTMLAESLSGIALNGCAMPNFVIKKNDKSEKYGIAKQIQSNEERAEAKRAYMTSLVKQFDATKLLPNDLKAQILQTYKQICDLEAGKYDLEKRHERQLYDLKELTERERQVARHRALQRGLDPNEAAASRHPPKVNVASKFDRQFDRRSYGDRRTIFEQIESAKVLSIVHGTARPPPEWGRSENEELEQLRKIIEPHRYNEQIKVDTLPPIQPIPLNIPTD